MPDSLLPDNLKLTLFVFLSLLIVDVEDILQPTINTKSKITDKYL